MASLSAAGRNYWQSWTACFPCAAVSSFWSMSSTTELRALAAPPPGSSLLLPPSEISDSLPAPLPNNPTGVEPAAQKTIIVAQADGASAEVKPVPVSAPKAQPAPVNAQTLYLSIATAAGSVAD